jgi:glycosyltransferase involved in cell wall biosynthesis
MGAISDRFAIAALYDGAQCFVAHSRLEAFPLTPFEALSRGLSVFATDIPPHREICGDAASYYPVDDVERLETLLVEDAETGAVPPLATRSWSDNASQLIEILRAVASISEIRTFGRSAR